MVLLVKLCQRTKAREREMLIPDKLATFQSPNYIAVGRRICVSYPADLDQISTAKKLMTEMELTKKREKNAKQQTTHTTPTFSNDKSF